MATKTETRTVVRCDAKVGAASLDWRRRGMSRYHGDDPTVCGERAHFVVAGVDMCHRHKRQAERHAIGHDNARQRIEQCVREIEILCDQFGYDRNEWLAELPETTASAPAPQTRNPNLDEAERRLLFGSREHDGR